MSAIQPTPKTHDWSPADVKAGSTPTLRPIDKNLQIPDDQEPITFLKNAIAKVTGKELKDCPDLTIKGSFQTVDGDDTTIKLMAYRNPPQNLKAPSCFYFERLWTVTVKDKDGNEQTLSFKKNVYTNVVIPTNYDANLLHDKEAMATIAARAYSNAVVSAIQVSTGQNPKYQLTQDQITKLQRDNFLTMGLYHGEDKISPNKIKTSSFKTRKITHVKLEFRAGKKEAKDELSDDSAHIINLLAKKTGKSTPKPEPKYLLVADQDPNTHPEVKRVSTLQKLQYENPDLAPEELIEKLDFEGVGETEAGESLKTELDRMQSDFLNDLASFTDAAAVDDVRNLAKPGTTAVSQEVKDLLPHMSHRKGLKRLFSKKQAPPENLAVLTALLREAGQHSQALNKEIEELIESYQKLYERMQQANIKMLHKEKMLSKLTVSDVQIQEIKQRAKLRQDSLELLKEKFKERHVTNTSTDTESSEDSLSSVDSDVDSDDESVDSSDISETESKVDDNTSLIRKKRSGESEGASSSEEYDPDDLT